MNDQELADFYTAEAQKLNGTGYHLTDSELWAELATGHLE